ncbi:hypothetical protein E2C01_092353 [Portunus trituberculatus]|uniref:Uncharacterized protein n=1 Tax=Portunus trituberculatus TaxID=210409 RepID=A0A5B7JXJ1_PORTR|nr:hypothetical protein [Portunus trituberculatus]
MACGGAGGALLYGRVRARQREVPRREGNAVVQ